MKLDIPEKSHLFTKSFIHKPRQHLFVKYVLRLPELSSAFRLWPNQFSVILRDGLEVMQCAVLDSLVKKLRVESNEEF